MTVTRSENDSLQENADLIFLSLVAAIGAFVSIARTGFVFGVNNNLFHLPIVVSLYDEPQFVHDQFIQSLHFFSSGIWLVLNGIGRVIDPYWLFLALDYSSRFIAFAGFLLCANILGVRTRTQRVLFAGILCMTSLMQGDLYAGDGGLFIAYFTHSEVANGVTLFMLYLIVRGQLMWAIAMNGVVFFINAFVAVWNIVPFAAITIFLILRRDIIWQKFLLEGILGLVLAGLLAAPVIHNIISNSGYGRPVDFNYIVFLQHYYPLHFLFWSIPIKQKIEAVIVVLLAAMSFIALKLPAQPFLLALVGYALVYAVGIVMPRVTDNPAILNLHLLRASTMFHLLAGLGTTALATHWLTSDETLKKRVLGLATIFLLCASRHLFLVVPFILFAALWPAGKRLVPTRIVESGIRFDYIAMICLLIIWPCHVWKQSVQNRNETEWVSEWSAVGQWARLNTPIDAIFLISIEGDDFFDSTTHYMQRSKLRLNSTPSLGGGDDYGIFQFASHRRVWVDMKEGAAVMWYPSYYDTWWPRISAVVGLVSHDERIHYAQKNKIDYVVENCENGEMPSPIYRTRRLCLFAVPPT